MTTVFFSYSHRDEAYRDQLETHLAMLKRQGLIETWHDRRIVAGDELHGRIGEELERADVILLLVSADFLASDYCYDREMLRAIERHDAGEARVIPIILRPCDWEGAPFGKLRASPNDGKPVSTFPDLDVAFLSIVRDIKQAIGPSTPGTGSDVPVIARAEPELARSTLPRSSNLGLKKTFSQADKDRFRDESFGFMCRFFEGSLEELQARNEQIETAFRMIDANHFVARIYANGELASACRIGMGDQFGNAITFAHGESPSGVNEMLNVEADDHGMHLKGMGMPNFGSKVDHLSPEGAAEYYWSLLIGRLQR